jgi:hemolysin activation/secretion protein
VTRLRLSNDSAVHNYKYDAYKMDKAGISPKIFYSNEDRIYVGLGYKIQKQKWRKEPFGAQHKIDVKYSLAQKAFSSSYESIFTQLFGKWDMNIFAEYDQVRWTNFFGLGNETALTTKERDFNRVRSQQFIGKLGVQRVINGKQRITFNPFFQSYDIINDTSRYLAKNPVLTVMETYKAHQFAGAELEYLYQNINDSVLPTKGFNVLTFANFSQSLKTDRNVTRFGLQANLYVPLSRQLGITVKAGGASLTGEPEFYQYNVVGGTETLRGHQRDRFYGKSTVYNQNELRWISDVRSYLYSGKIGFFGFYDMGRVWLPGETSNTLHSGYGGGLLLVPFNKIALSVAYGMSKEDNNIHIRIKKAL